MVATQQLLDSLKSIGLNLYERRLWVALLSRGVSTAGELFVLARVPHSRCYDVLEGLAEKGFVMIQNTKPLKYVAINPNEAIERAKKKMNENTEVSIKRLSDMQKSNIMKELESIFKNGVSLVNPGEMSGSLKGKHAIHQQFETSFKSAKKKISLVTTQQGLKDLHEKHLDVLRKASSRGVKIKIAADSKDAPIINEFRKFADIRKLPKNIGRFCMIDDSQLILAMTDEDKVHQSQDLSLWAESEHVAGQTFGHMFDILWNELKKA